MPRGGKRIGAGLKQNPENMADEVDWIRIILDSN